MEHKDVNSFENIIKNIKHEPEAEFVLILPPVQTLETIKTEESEIAESSKSSKSKIKSGNLKSKSSRKLKGNHEKAKLRNFQCDSCGQKFKNKSLIKKHISQMKLRACCVCSQTFQCRHELYAHRNAHKLKGFKCDQCSFFGTSLSNFLVHKNIHNKIFSCETCGKKFSRKDAVVNHQMHQRHGDYSKAPENKFECEKCDYSSPFLRYLNNHQKFVHSDIKAQVQCKICSKMFKNKSYLGTHMTTHLEVSCKICGKKTNKRYLSRHIKEEHYESTEYNCDLCGRQFCKRNNIKSHMRDIHPHGEFVCTLCYKKFTKIEEILNHKRIHLGRRRYRCLVCDHEAISYFFLKRHFSKMHESLPAPSLS